MNAAFDTLAAARELEGAGIARDHAAAIASVARRVAADTTAADHDALAAKAGIAGMAMKTDIADMAMKIGEMGTKIAELETRIYRALWLQAAGLVAIMVGLEIFG